MQVRHADDPRPFLVMPARADREDLFTRWCATGDEFLSPVEVNRAIDELWPQLNHRKVVALAFRAADTAGDKLIDRRAFKRLLQHVMFLSDRFQVLETVNSRTNGRISCIEFRKVLPLLGISVRQTQANDEFDAIDEDDAGFILFEELCEWAARYHAHETVPTNSLQHSRSRSLSPRTSPTRAPSPRRSRSPSPGARSRSRSPEQSWTRRAPELRLDRARLTLVDDDATQDFTVESLREQRRPQPLSSRRRGRTKRVQEHRQSTARGSTPLLVGHDRSVSRTDVQSSASSESSFSSDSDESPFLVFHENGSSPREGMSREAAARARRDARRAHPSTQWKGADFSDWPPSGRIDSVRATDNEQLCR